MTTKEYKNKLKKMGNAQLLDEMDCFFGYDPYYRENRIEITKELERRLNVIIVEGKRKNKGEV